MIMILTFIYKMAPPFQKTPEGIESQFAINHISSFLFTNLIMPKLLKSPNPRVIVISSLGHTWGKVRFDVGSLHYRIIAIDSS